MLVCGCVCTLVWYCGAMAMLAIACPSIGFWIAFCIAFGAHSAWLLERILPKLLELILHGCSPVFSNAFGAHSAMLLERILHCFWGAFGKAPEALPAKLLERILHCFWSAFCKAPEALPARLLERILHCVWDAFWKASKAHSA